MRRWVSSIVHRSFQKLINSRYGYEALLDALGSRVGSAKPVPEMRDLRSVYPELAGHARSEESGGAKSPVFVTARFRSGSTLLWNLFRRHPDFTALYEPLNERRWFDVKNRGSNVDQTHQGATDYWSEYDGVEVPAGLFSEQWGRRGLWMSADTVNAGMHAYIKLLATNTRQRAVLQFNRMDFRLPWLRRHFPSASIVHLYRHPREQWCSTLRLPSGYTPEMGWEEFFPYDRFYLSVWARDLRRDFPVLDQARSMNAYATYYLIWRLSHAFGSHYSDTSIAYESLIGSTQETLDELSDVLGVSRWTREQSSIVSGTSGDKWPQWASADWFDGVESTCEAWLGSAAPDAPQAVGMMVSDAVGTGENPSR